MRFDIIRYYLYTVFGKFLFFLPIQVIFFKDSGLSMTEIFILMSSASLAVILLEIPTGAIADYLGKKISIVSGIISQAVACFIFFQGNHFWIFLLAYLFWGLGSTLMSGADVALLYDILNTNKKTELFKRIRANSQMVALISTASGAIIGGIVASYSLSYTYLLNGISLILGLIVVSTISHKEIKDKKRTGYRKIIKESFEIIRKNSLLIFLFTYSALFITVIKLIRPSSQLYFQISGLPLHLFGLAMAYLFIIRAIAAKNINFFEKVFKKKIYWAFSFIMVASLLIISSFAFKLGFLVLGLVFMGMPIINTLVENDALKATPKDKHSTILSFKNQFRNFLGIMAGPIYGLSIDKFGFQSSSMYLSIFLAVVFVFLLINIDLSQRKKQFS